jgi:[calcium/calmodulin-dependent protein kinase] kinase
MTLAEVAEHVWVIGNDGPIGEYWCWCKRKSVVSEDFEESNVLV